VWVAIQGSSTAFVSARATANRIVDISTNKPAVTDRISVKGEPTRHHTQFQADSALRSGIQQRLRGRDNTKTHQIIEGSARPRRKPFCKP